MMKRLLHFSLILGLVTPLGAQGRRAPTIDELISVQQPGGTVISPDGTRIVYSVGEVIFDDDRFVTNLWLIEVSTGQQVQLTRGKDSANSAAWSPDGRWISFTRSHEGKAQLFAIPSSGGEAVRLTASETGVSDYEWSHDGARVAFTANDPESGQLKGRKDSYGDFEVVRGDYTFAHIYTFDFAEALGSPQKGERRTSGTDFTVQGLSWSPDGSRIAFAGSINPDLVNRSTSNIYILQLEGNAVRELVPTPGPDYAPIWSPDGTRLLFTTAAGRTSFYALNSRLAEVEVNTGRIRLLSEAFDENPSSIAWKPDGIYFLAAQKTSVHLFRLDPSSLRIAKLSRPDALIASSFTLTKDGQTTAFVAASPTSLREVFVAGTADFNPRQLTNWTNETESFDLATREVISWKSQDGTEIEGVLHKPSGFDPSQKHPLLCVIHGGPTGIDRPALLERGTRYYPVDIWTSRGALVLRVNYRGSAGYGEAFRTLNRRNLGVGDAWDVISGVDHLIEKGWVDPRRVGVMGWSQGGYISAFLTASSDRFAAVSVGAGISNWATYYYNTDITPFTINYLGDDPVDDPEIYQKTSPMTYIKQARTPTLIQHGENDRRVPIPNAYELRQGLEDRGVPVEMVVYKGFGHGITKPKAMRAVMQHNLDWFNHYIWGDPMPDLRNPGPAVEKEASDAPSGDPGR